MNHQQIIERINSSPYNKGLDAEEWLADANNLIFTQKDDLMMFDFAAPGVYEIHILCRSRGRAVLDFTRRAFRFIFGQHNAEIVFALVPADRRDVKLVARWSGMLYESTRSTEFGPCELYVLPRAIWEKENHGLPQEETAAVG